MFPFMMFDSTMILLIPGLLLAGWAQLKIKRTFLKYDQFDARSGMTADSVAKDIIQRGGLPVEIGRVSANMTDNYAPRNQTLNMSDSTYRSRSLAAIGVAAHEAGHAFQHAQGYFPLSLRTNFVPVANFGSMLGMPMFFIGLFMGYGILVELGVVFFSFAVLFGILTLPVEFNASSRAIRILSDGGYLTAEEIPAARKVLNAAAWTYVASAVMAVLSLIRLLILSGLLGGRDD